MMASTIKKQSSKVAEIYREDCGRICYLCFHCGFDSDNINDILDHIEIHFPSQNSIRSDDHPDLVDIKCEPVDDPQPLTNPKQIEQIFVDCGSKPISDKEECEEIDGICGDDIDVETTVHQLDDDLTHLECLFEWKCLHCYCLFKKGTKLLQHLTQKHKGIPELSLIHGTEKVRAHYSLKCTLCSTEFHDAHSSEQHLKDFHPAPPALKCFVCCEKFKSTESMTVHMTTVHGGKENEDTVQAEPTKTVSRKKTPAEKVNKRSVCTLCDRTFTGTPAFMQHIFGHFSLKIFSCSKCPTNFQRLSTYNAHMKKVHRQGIPPKLVCRFCNDNVDHESFHEFLTHSFTQHLDDGDRNNTVMDTSFEYRCKLCLQPFTKWIEASTHLKGHANHELPSELPSAAISADGRNFTERARSQAHRSELLYNCLSCATTLSGSLEARNHQITEHKSTVKSVRILQTPPTEPVTYRIVYWPEKPVKKDYKCFDCVKSFETKVHLMRHRLSHFNINPYSCTVCPRKFGSNANATRHISKEHSKSTSTGQLEYLYRTLLCSFCQAEFTDDSYFIEHSFKEHLYENFNIDQNLDQLCKYECMYCGEIILERHCMDQHLQTHTNDALPVTNAGDEELEESSINQLRHKSEFKYVCLHCPLKFRLPFVAISHSMLHKTELQEKNLPADATDGTVSVIKKDSHCHTCNITFLTWRSMINHSAKVHPETIVRSPNYKKKVVQQTATKSKKKKRRAPEGNQCQICNMTFLSNRSMINHRTKRHPESVKLPQKHPMHSCTTCGKSFRERGNLVRHVETHTKVRTYSCDICDKSYGLKNSLDTHMLTHTNEKNFVCEECGKSFYTISKLNLHKQVHENLTLHCDKCEKVFYTRKNFSKHQRTHLDSVRKKCKICGNTFKSAVSLRVHMFLHDDKKKYSCRYCDMTFAQSSGRRGHERSKHGFV